MRAAMILTSWYLKETARIQSATSLQGELKQAQRLLEWLQAQDKALVWIGDIYRNGPSVFRRAQDARSSLRVLEDHGWVQPVNGIVAVNDVLRREVWQLAASPST